MHYMYIPHLPIHLLMDIWIVSTSWLITYNTAVNVGVYISLWDPAFSYCGCILRSFSEFFICHTLTAEFVCFLYCFFTHVLYLFKYSLLMVFLSSLNISKTVVLKAVNRQSSIVWASSGIISVITFSFSVTGWYFLCMTLSFYWKIDILNILMWQFWKSYSALSLGFVLLLAYRL